MDTRKLRIPRPLCPRLCALLAILAGLLAWGGSSSAQIPEDIPLLQRLGTGARAMGMGGAYVAVADDYSALYYNPAGLAQITRVEVGGAIDHTSAEQINTYLGHSESTPLNKSNLQSLGFAYPFPTYRGSLVIAFSYERDIPLDAAYYRSGSGGLVHSEVEEMLSDGGVAGWRVGLASDVSQEVSLGATVTLMDGSATSSRSFLYMGSDPQNQDTVYTSNRINYSAISGSLGALIRSPGGLRFGLALHLPEKYSLSDAGDAFVADYRAGYEPYFDSRSFDSDVERIQLPYRVAAGVSWVPQGLLSGLLLSADATYADWSQVTHTGTEPPASFRTKDRGYAYRATTDLRLGAEYTFQTLPIRLRAGFISQPVAYRLIATDVFYGGYENAKFLTDRRYGTVGAGLILEKSLTLDVAYVFGGYERSGRSPDGETIEKVKDRRAYLGAAFRL